MEIIQLRPFLFTSYRDWLIASGFKPHIRIAYEEGESPDFLKRFINPEGEIHFNISPLAIGNFQVDEGGVSFSARFSGKLEEVFVPLDCLVSIYGHGTGIEFAISKIVEPHDFHPHFKKIKADIKEAELKKTASLTQQLKLTNALTDASRYEKDDKFPDPPKTRKGRAKLKIVK